jgi:hypothetical protein
MRTLNPHSRAGHPGSPPFLIGLDLRLFFVREITWICIPNNPGLQTRVKLQKDRGRIPFEPWGHDLFIKFFPSLFH